MENNTYNPSLNNRHNPQYKILLNIVMNVLHSIFKKFVLTSYISISLSGSLGASQARDISVLFTLVTCTLPTMAGTVKKICLQYKGQQVFDTLIYVLSTKIDHAKIIFMDINERFFFIKSNIYCNEDTYSRSIFKSKRMFINKKENNYYN